MRKAKRFMVNKRVDRCCLPCPKLTSSLCLLKSSSSDDLEDYMVRFESADKFSEFPFWNLLNGPIADAINHVGQVVSFRRSSGNPIHPGVRVFIGKTKE